MIHQHTKSDKKVSKPFTECDLIMEAQTIETLLTNMNKHKSVCSAKIEWRSAEKGRNNKM